MQPHELANIFYKLASYQPLTQDFWVKFVQMCQRLQVDPLAMATLINSESGFNPSAKNGSTIKGLNQLSMNTAVKGLGMSEATWNAYETMPAEEQLKWVEAFFKRTGGQGAPSVGKLYALNFGGYPNPDGSLYANKAAQESWVASHPGDKGKFKNPEDQHRIVEAQSNTAVDGKITRESLTNWASKRFSPAIKQKVEEAIATVGTSSPPPYEPPNPNWGSSVAAILPEVTSYFWG